MTNSNFTRRSFIKRSAAISAATALSSLADSALSEEKLGAHWKASLEDPVRRMITGQPDLDSILSLFPRTTGEAAFDPKAIAEHIKRLQTQPAINTGHPFVDLSVRTGLAHIDATFRGDHPKYGVGRYADDRHDGFPPIIIAAVDALSSWALNSRATQLFRYWLSHFVRDNGTFKYYGPSITEYGQILHTAALLEERAGTESWWHEGFSELDRISEYLLQLHASAAKEGGLISGVPEADTRTDIGKYFHNNAWASKGLQRWAELCERRRATPTTTIPTIRKVSTALARDTLRAIQTTWPDDPSDWWLPPRVEPLARPTCLTGTREASYTNYRYWPELLSSGLLPHNMANRIVNARLSAGGQFCGMTRFLERLDDWPLTDYLYGIWSLGRKSDFLLSLYGHIAYHQAEGHLTAYEQVTFPPGRKVADYCLPCQLVAARAARLLVQ
ncbi:MAG: hypothetical protein ACYS74_01425 [Planctomycetota bacterium]|jgi:hypothetical protein